MKRNLKSQLSKCNAIVILFFVYSISIAQNFQDTKGELSISNSGTANYTIPIATPPSLNGVAPIINLTYNSGARGGIAGQGWSISSISSITRISTRKDIDGFVDGVDFDDNDKLALDGQRLLLKTGTYWANGSTYETEYKSNIKIELIIHTQSAINGPARSFIVTQPDGSRTWYGSRQGDGIGYSRTSRNAWYIVRHEDVYGNSINYEYITYSSASVANSGNLYISKIWFGGNESQSLPHLNSIDFNYVEAARLEKDFIIGKSTSGIVTSSNPSYATQILDNITVNTQGALFRKYQLTRSTDDDGYQRVTQVQEFNGANEASNPVTFVYDTSPSTANRTEKEYYNNLAFDSVSLAGDFDGDGRIDFVANNQLYTNLFSGGSGNTSLCSLPSGGQFSLTATTLKNNKLNQSQSLVKIFSTSTNTQFKIYNLEQNQFVESYTINFPLDRNTVNTYSNNTGSTYGIMCNGYYQNYFPPIAQNSYVEYNEGDFNGDGISEILVKITKTDNHYVNGFVPWPNPLPNPFDPNLCNITNNPTSTTKYYLVDLNNSNSSYGSTELESNSPTALEGSKYLSDFNGDGKTDILAISSSGGSSIYTYDPYGYYNLKFLGYGGLTTDYSSGKQMLFGDYNGDGKTDIALPTSSDPNGYSGSVNWAIYYSNPSPNGSTFFTKETHDIVEYWSDTGDAYDTQRHWSTYYAMDVNKDGKSDIVRVWRKYYKPSWTINDHNTAWQVTAYTNTIGKTGPGWSQTYNSDFYAPFMGGQILVHLNSDSPDIPIPIAGNFKHNGANTDLVIVRGHYNKIEYYSFNKDFNRDNRLLQVKESNDKIVHTIQYSPMEAIGGGLGNSQTDFYSSTNTAVYPNIELIKNPTSYLVSKLTATINDVSKFQDFRYHGYVSNFVYGSIGFKRTTRSSWYLQPSDPKIWTTENNDISLRGANTITWSSTNGLTVFDATPTDLLSTKTNYFSTYTFPSKVYNVLLNQQTTLDALTGVKIDKLYSYDGTVDTLGTYGLQTSVTTNVYSGTTLQGSTTTSTPIEEYANNPTGVGNAYYIGKPKKVTTSSTIYNASGFTDTRTSEEKYTYTGANITKTEKKGHNTNYLEENMTYDAVGNLLTKTVSMPTASPAIASRTIVDEYEPTKRFVKKKIDHQLFETLLEYNALGQVTKSTNYLGVISNFAYDNWGKITTSTTTGASTNALVTTTSYAKLSDGRYTVTSLNSSGDNAMSKTTYDVLGRVVKTTTKGFANYSEISKTIEYDALGRKYRESEPYFSSPSKWTTYQYDNLHRPTQVTMSTGRIQTLSYSELTTTSVDDGKTTTITVDALGNKVITTDPGGTINFTYFANGALQKTNYGGHEITNTIDGWGNKISTFDPNAGNPSGPNGGNYSYSYDAFGQMLTETTPKGTTTFTYDATGKVLTKKAIGDGADFNTTYAYNAFAQLESETTTTTAGATIDTYGYTYDALHRLTTTSENNAYLEHTKTIGYDAIGRTATETNYTREKSTTNFSSSVITKYVYNTYNGILEKITDNNNVMLWQLNSANEKMQTLTATLGNGIAITNTYDTNYYFATQQHKKATVFIVNNSYSFDGVKGNLNNRYNLAPGMNIYENFTYDTQDRLLTWKNPVTGVMDSNVYDDRGRITTNNKLGDVSYNGDYATGIYRKEKVALNTEGKAYYNALNGNQIVAYNMFKSPISINESNKGKCDFMYNSHESRSRMLYDNRAIAPSTTRLQRKTKLYTDDGSTEVIYDIPNNTIKIITFVGGDAYGAVMYNEKTRSSTGVEASNNFYLHRDYLGSIIAITNSAGVAIEKRHFDAWGNLAKIVNSSNVALPLANGLVVLDRGYTSHEHLKEVGLIHMNGRLYDPVLRSFLMPDNFVQQPENTQNYNRYSYVLNNPLKYTDVSGEEFTLLTAVIVGAIIAATSYTLTALLADVPFSVGGLAKATFIGAASAAVTFGIGSGAESLFANFYSRAAFQAIAHGTFQGGMTAISGGKFWSGFAAGALSSIASSAYSGGNSYSMAGKDGVAMAGTGFNSIGDNLGDAGMIAFGTVSGGAGAALTGGNFWQGAVTGLMVSGLNHTFHNIQEKHKFFNRLRNHYEGKSGEDFVLSEKEFKFLVRKGDINYNKFVRVGENRYEVSINFYDSDSDLALSFGRATLSYSVVNDKKVFDGFYDRYDFDSKEWGVRSNTNEALTRTYNTLFEGKSYNIYYNKTYFTNYEKIYYNNYDIERFNKR